jgi:hypothetical protein
MMLYKSLISVQKTIDGLDVFTNEKTNLNILQVGDKFTLFKSGRYIVGEILDLPINVETDLDNSTKILLILDN